jgi:hypothetical protein
MAMREVSSGGMTASPRLESALPEPKTRPDELGDRVCWGSPSYTESLRLARLSTIVAAPGFLRAGGEEATQVMARNARPTAAKREREKSLLERRQQKAARRIDAKERREHTGPRQGDEDPDIAHITPGPQPLADWQIEDEVEE